MALVGRGQVYSIDLQEGEKYIAHPRYVMSCLSQKRRQQENMFLTPQKQRCCLQYQQGASHAVSIQVEFPQPSGIRYHPVSVVEAVQVR